MELVPAERESRGRLALMLLNDARRATRRDEAGKLVLLEEPDRAWWDRRKIDEGCVLVEQALQGGGAGRYAVQAAIAEGFERGLALMDAIDLPGYHLLPAAQADLLRRLGRKAEAATAYRAALRLITNDAERRFLERRLKEVDG